MNRFLDITQYDTLKRINRRLFGDGSTLTPDERRDLANVMAVTLDQIEIQTLDEVSR